MTVWDIDVFVSYRIKIKQFRLVDALGTAKTHVLLGSPIGNPLQQTNHFVFRKLEICRPFQKV